MDDYRERGDLTELDRLLGELAGDMADGMRRREKRRRVGRRASVAVAVGFVVAAVYLAREPAPTSPQLALEPALDVASSRPFALFSTSRDDITVIWLLTPEAP